MKRQSKPFAIDLLSGVAKNRRLIGRLAKNDFRTRFAGSYLGIIWAFVQPVVTVLVYWLVFGFGFKSPSDSDVPFVLYLTCGIVPWFYAQEILISGTAVLLEYSYLVKKVVFEIAVLPFVKALSAFFVHAFFILVAIVIGICYGTCAVVVFFRDLSQIIAIALQIGIWSVPIMFSLKTFESSSFAWIFRINPMYYIVTGYRDAIYGRVWFWERGWYTAYFWAWAVLMFILGTHVFRKLRVHFADVL